jgi:hypothetical protein
VRGSPASHRRGTGGKISGWFDDAAMFDTIASVIDANSTPLDHDDQRPTAQPHLDTRSSARRARNGKGYRTGQRPA